MHIHHFLFCAVFTLLSLVSTDEDFFELTMCCTLRGPDMEDIEYSVYEHFNGKLLMQYNSTAGIWTGFTPRLIEEVKQLNSYSLESLNRFLEMGLLCTDNIPLIKAITNNLTTAPTIKLNSVKVPVGRHRSMLVCSAYDFYPKLIRMTWLKNGREMTSDVSSSKVMPNGGLYFQSHSYLGYTPTPGETITCMVEHLGFRQPVLKVWDPSFPVPERIKTVVGVLGLVFGFVLMSSGSIYYKKKSAAHVKLCQGRVRIPVEGLPSTGEMLSVQTANT